MTPCHLNLSPQAVHQFMHDGRTLTAAPYPRAPHGSPRWMRAINGVPVRDAAGRPFLCDTAEQALAFAGYDLDDGGYDSALRALRRAKATVSLLDAARVHCAVNEGIWCGPEKPPPFDSPQFCRDAMALFMETGPLHTLRLALDALVEAKIEDLIDDCGAVQDADQALCMAVETLFARGGTSDTLRAACGLWGGAMGGQVPVTLAAGGAPLEPMTDELIMLAHVQAWHDRNMQTKAGGEG